MVVSPDSAVTTMLMVLSPTFSACVPGLSPLGVSSAPLKTFILVIFLTLASVGVPLKTIESTAFGTAKEYSKSVSESGTKLNG